MANLSQLAYTRWNNNIKVRQELCEYYRTADQQVSLPKLSANLVTISLLCVVKNIQDKKHFLITPQNQKKLQLKQISKVT